VISAMEKVLGRRSQWHLIGKELCVCCQTLIRFYQLRVAIHWSIRGYQRSAATDYHFERNTTDLRKMEAEQKINQVDDSDDLWMARVEHVPTRSLLGALWSERISVCPSVCTRSSHGGGRRRSGPKMMARGAAGRAQSWDQDCRS